MDESKFKYSITYKDGKTTIAPMDGTGVVTIRRRKEAEMFVRMILENYSMTVTILTVPCSGRELR